METNITTTNTTLDIAVHLQNWDNARYLLEACNPGSCTASNEVTTLGQALNAIGYVKASNTEGGDNFGIAVTISGDGNTLVVGAYQESSNATGIGSDEFDNSAFGAGAVYVYTQDRTGAWSQQAYVKATNTDAPDVFGFAVALNDDGNTLVVGAQGEDSNATGVGGDGSDNSALEVWCCVPLLKG